MRVDLQGWGPFPAQRHVDVYNIIPGPPKIILTFKDSPPEAGRLGRQIKSVCALLLLHLQEPQAPRPGSPGGRQGAHPWGASGK